ncbi:MAG: MarR family transcriptional regulator [Burkholderiales bacterium]
MSTAPPAAFYCAEQYRPDGSVGFLMRRVMQSVVQQVDRRLAQHELTHAQWVPLFKLLMGPGSTVAELAREIQLDPGAVTRALDRLEAKGLVQRVRSSTDRRVVQLVLTEHGRSLAAMVPAVLSEVLNGHLAGFSAAEHTALLDMLQRMLANGCALREQEGNASLSDGE